ncbi:PfkB family carbohydrate kinase [Brevibacillus laterosporus]|uniref:Sugar kinase n=1 Tax=Brevibacillus laterosporus TaxID=1465 RepID=A0A0F7EK82_BRELA|nr:PfkB family carbohydrate kinase [Brevibacillus laterosporus]AKF96178.1 sugar kinase [Brevibacillus laterosporus]
MSLFLSVLGTVFMDVKGFPFQAYEAKNRNLGNVQFVHGGVGRNIAENLGRAGCPTAFVSVLETTGMGPDVENRLKAANVSTDYSHYTKHGGMGMWMVILDETGELQGSISQMPDLKQMEQLIKDRGEEIVQASSHIITELDLNHEIISHITSLAKKHNKPIYGLPANMEIVLEHPELLHEFDCFVCNNYEADKIFSIDFTNMEIADQLAVLTEYMNHSGLQQMVITLGEKGSVFYDKKTGAKGHQPVFPVNLVDCSGAGDAYFSGIVMGLSTGLTLQEAVICGTRVAGWTIESTESICPDLMEKIEQNQEMRDLLFRHRLVGQA